MVVSVCSPHDNGRAQHQGTALKYPQNIQNIPLPEPPKPPQPHLADCSLHNWSIQEVFLSLCTITLMISPTLDLCYHN